jgi:uncharacterized protein YcbX
MPDGAVVSLFRYPVKSMMGEEVNRSHVAARGLLGDRSLALLDVETGNVVSAKNPKKWLGMFDFRAVFTSPPAQGGGLPPVRVTLPDGMTVTTDSPGFDDAVSAALGRKVRLAIEVPPQPSLEQYWPDMVELSYQATVTDEALPVGTFFDAATIHVLTTASIDRLGELSPASRFEARRFRPNIVIRPVNDEPGFVEDEWIGRKVHIGDDVVLAVTGHCGRCIMTTLAQGDLPKDSKILRTAARHNHVHVGICAEVSQSGVVRRGDLVTVR